MDHDYDNDTPPEQVKYDIGVGIKRLKEGMEMNGYGEPGGDGLER